MQSDVVKGQLSANIRGYLRRGCDALGLLTLILSTYWMAHVYNTVIYEATPDFTSLSLLFVNQKGIAFLLVTLYIILFLEQLFRRINQLSKIVPARNFYEHWMIKSRNLTTMVFFINAIAMVIINVWPSFFAQMTATQFHPIDVYWALKAVTLVLICLSVCALGYMMWHNLVQWGVLVTTQQAKRFALMSFALSLIVAVVTPLLGAIWGTKIDYFVLIKEMI